MVEVADIWDDAMSIFGTCTESQVYRHINDAVELIASKGEWEPLHAYLDTVVNEDHSISLPPDVESPLAVSVNGSAAPSTDKLFAYHANGPGDCWDPCGWRWADRDLHATLVDLETPDTIVAVAAGAGLADPVAITLVGIDDDTGFEVTETIDTSNPGAGTTSTTTFRSIRIIAKARTAVGVTVKTTGNVTLAALDPATERSQYRRIIVNKASPNGTDSVRIYYRRRTAKVATLTDWIALPQRYAITMMLRAIRAYNDGDIVGGTGYELQAARMTAERNKFMQPPTSMPIQIEMAGSLYDANSDGFGDD